MMRIAPAVVLLNLLTLTGLGAAAPDLTPASLHDAEADPAALVTASDDQTVVTATGRESFHGLDEGTFAYLTTDAPRWTFTARIAAAEEGSPMLKYGIAAREGTQKWSRAVLLRYDSYEGNRALQWLYRYGVSHGTHHGHQRVSHFGVQKDASAREGFWLRIERDYPTFSLAWSEDGQTWQPMAADEQLSLLPLEMQVGLMATAGGDGKSAAKVTYDHVTFEEHDDAEQAAGQPLLGPESFTDYSPLMDPWVMHLAEVLDPPVAAGQKKRKDESATYFIIKPESMAWEDVRGFFYTTSSKETVVQNDDGTLVKLQFDSGDGKLRKPAGMAEFHGTYELRPDPLYRVFEHYGLVRLGTAGGPEGLEAGLQALAQQTGYPGIVNIPWVNQGMSFAGGDTARAARLYPQKTIAASPTHIGVAGWGSEDPAVLAVPHLYVIGTKDGGHRGDALAAAESGRKRGALWGFAPLHWFYHSIGHTVSVSMPFFVDVMDLRLPAEFNAAKGPVELKTLKEEDGYLALADTIDSNFPQVVKWSDATEQQRRGSTWWLPTERSARIWQASTSDWPRTVIHFPRFDPTDGWSGPPGERQVHHQMAADEPFNIMASGKMGPDVRVEYYADLEPLKVIFKYRNSPYLVRVEGLPPGLHNLYAITTYTDAGGKEQKEISRPQMIYFHERK